MQPRQIKSDKNNVKIPWKIITAVRRNKWHMCAKQEISIIHLQNLHEMLYIRLLHNSPQFLALVLSARFPSLHHLFRGRLRVGTLRFFKQTNSWHKGIYRSNRLHSNSHLYTSKHSSSIYSSVYTTDYSLNVFLTRPIMHATTDSRQHNSYTTLYQYSHINCNSPPILALKATPTQQFELLASAATSPAHRVPWLKNKQPTSCKKCDFVYQADSIKLSSVIGYCLTGLWFTLSSIKLHVSSSAPRPSQWLSSICGRRLHSSSLGYVPSAICMWKWVIFPHRSVASLQTVVSDILALQPGPPLLQVTNHTLDRMYSHLSQTHCHVSSLSKMSNESSI
jgi:hypothetical protein